MLTPSKIYAVKTSWKTFKQYLLLCQPKTVEVILPPELLFPWEDNLPDAIEILEEDHDPTPKINMEIFDAVLNDLMKEPSRLYTDVDFLTEQINTKKCCNAGSVSDLLNKVKKKKKITSYKYEAITDWVNRGKPYQEPLSVRCPVWKRPSEYRDAVALNPSTLYNVWFSNANIKSVFGHLPEWADGCNQEILTRFRSKGEFFIMTDYKKSGLTLPHWFVERVNKKVKERFPLLELNIPVEGWKIYDRKLSKFFEPKDFGYSLGMVNHYYTLWNIVTFKYAQRINIFSPKDTMLSFNDDSVINCQKASYYTWQKCIRDFGGYLDVHKTFAAKGAQFCEIHSFKDINNFKWVSAFHTLWSSLWKSINFDNWRYIVGEMFDQLQVLQEDINNLRVKNTEIWGNVVEIIRLNGTYFFAKDIPEDMPFELGGVNFLKDRTRLGLKKWLLKTEQLFNQGNQNWKVAVYTKDAFAYKPVYRPWKVLPKGLVKDTFKFIGEFEGLNHELISFKDKAQNKFILDKEFYQENFWTHFAQQMDKARKEIEENKFIDFISWVRSNHFYGCALPRTAVKSHVDFLGKQLPFVRVQKERSLYSLQSMMVNYVWSNSGKVPLFDPNLIDFSKICQYECPVYSGEDCYAPIIDILLVGKINMFHDPRRVFLDIAERERIIPTELYIPDSMSSSMLELMKKIWKEDKYLPHFIGATWWTKLPIPFLAEWVTTITNSLPTVHVNVLTSLLEKLFKGEVIDLPNFEPIIDEKYILEHQKANPDFWKSKLKKRKEAQKKQSVKNAPKKRADPDEDNPFLQLNMDETLNLVQEFYSRQLPEKVQEPAPTGGFDVEALMKQFETLIQTANPIFEEEQLPVEDTQEVSEEDEDDLLAHYLDSNQTNWDQDNKPGDNGD